MFGDDGISCGKKLSRSCVHCFTIDLNGNEGSYQISPIYDLIPSRIVREARPDNQRSNDVIRSSNSGNRLKPLHGARQQQTR